MGHTSIMVESPIELLNIVPVNHLISRCQIKVCYVGDTPNRNGSVITKEVAREMANSLPGSPIVGYYNEAAGDFEEHNRRIEISGGKLKFEDTTRPYGFVDLNAKVWFQDYMDDGVIHTYLVTEGWLWTGQYPEAKRVISKGNNHSMELDPDSLDGTWTIDDNKGIEYFIINDAIFSKLCILGEDYEPCFEGSTITSFSLQLDDDFNQKIYSLMKEVKKLKGGDSIVENENKILEEEEKVTPTEFAAPAEEPAQEEILENEDKTGSFSLEDFQNLQSQYDSLKNEFDALNTKYSELENNFNGVNTKYEEVNTNYTTLLEEHETMKANYNSLVAFKAEKEKEAKQAMIDSFYMLSDDDKKEVQDNIDTYSIEEIESKLSVICVHNKLDMSEKKEDQTQVETTFSLNQLDLNEDANVPALVSLLRKAKNIEK